MNDRFDWQVRVYDKKDKLLDKWIIENRTEHEAFEEADAGLNEIDGVADWTMTKIVKKKVK
jgi:hypothetical protein